ncbi:glycosyltransferase family 4 protein [Megamonas funiformis]|uniref:glycosyltransferase family 4 protein n=1 Tax=Megamonas funiformis TaxID=437897 RepID=UPI00289AEE4D|nr:glycosyltransferase family 4 protein [Megamonas funiformis]
MKKILFISYTNFFGGAEYVLWDYLKRIDTTNMYIYTTNRKEVIDKYKQVLKKQNIFSSEKMDIVSIRKNFIKAMLNIFYDLYTINKIVKKYNIEVLYGNNTLDILLISLYRKYINSNIKVISHVHDILEKKMYIKYIKRNSKYIDKFIVPSIATKKSLILCNINDKKIEVVYNGIELHEDKKEQCNFIRKKFKINENKKIICIIGQVCKRKRQDLFINIVDCLNKKYNNKYVGIIIGKITDKDFYEEMKLKIQDPILFINDMKREEIFKYIYPNIDALILLSDRDPLPTVILEAMSRGTIVIARDVDGVSEIIENNKNGYIFKYDDNIPQIANFIEDIMAKPKNTKEIVKNNAKERIRQVFKLENKIKLINNLLEDD